jgi:hypothetical protein
LAGVSTVTSSDTNIPSAITYLNVFCKEAELNTELDSSKHGFPDELQTDAEREKIFAIVRHLLVANRVEIGGHR